ncbi:MAG: hypothetical protein E6Q55_35060, partial [Mycolicibacterium mageritense]
MRLYNPETKKFSDTARVTESLPWRSAAVYIYAKGRTTELVLDFDVKRHGAAQVTADLEMAKAWISSCGGVCVTDAATNGGRHLICPLAIGTSASCDEMTTLVRLFAARLPTLDITPVTNTDTGCISVPGSPDKHGGYRQLDGSLDDAIEALTTRSAPDLLPRLAKSPGLTVNVGPGSTYFYLCFNLRDPVLGDVRVRRALALALD